MLLTRETAEAELTTLPGNIGFFCQDTATGQEIAYHADLPVEAASVIKLSVMAEAFRQREASQLDWNRPVRIRPEDKLPSCGALTYLHDGLTLPVGDLVTLMMILSDNTATNLLIDLLGISNIQHTIDELGLSQTKLNRKLFMPELARQGIKNVVSAGDAARMMRLLLEGTLISAKASREMLTLLGQQRLNGKMPFYLHSRGIDCAHKTGEDDGITHDVGVIFADTPRIFCFVSEKTDVPQAERTLQRLAALCADIPAEELFAERPHS